MPRPKKPEDELVVLFRRNARAFVRAAERMVRVRAQVQLGHQIHDDEASLAATARVIGETGAIADLLGRRRLLMEADFARAKVPLELREARVFAAIAARDWVFASTPLVPDVSFKEAIADLVSREPRMAKSAEEVGALYSGEHAFALARSAKITITEKVQAIVARGTQVGLKLETAESFVKAAGPWTRAYAETVYRTNLSTAYTAGRFQQAADPDVAEVMGAFERRAVVDSDVRRGKGGDENHLAAHGLIASTADPVWRYASPPSGYNCRCSLRLVSKFELKRKGLLQSNGRVELRPPPNFDDFAPHPNFAGGRYQGPY